MAPQPKTRSEKRKSVSPSGTKSPKSNEQIQPLLDSSDQLNGLFSQLENLQIGTTLNEPDLVSEVQKLVHESSVETRPASPVATPRPKVPPRLRRTKTSRDGKALLPSKDEVKPDKVARRVVFEEVSVEASAKRVKSMSDEYFIKAFEVVEADGESLFRKRGVMLDMSMFEFRRNSYIVQYSRTFKGGKITHIQFGSIGNVKRVEELEGSEVTMSVDKESYVFNDFVVRITDTSIRIQSSVRKQTVVVDEEETLVLDGEAA